MATREAESLHTLLLRADEVVAEARELRDEAMALALKARTQLRADTYFDLSPRLGRHHKH